MSGYVVTEETIRLNAEAVELSAQVRRIFNDTNDQWKALQRAQIKYAVDMMERGRLEELLRAKEQEFHDAVQKGLNDAANQA